MGLATRDGHDGRQYTPVVETEYQRWPSAVLSRATMRAHRGSSATDGGVGFGVAVGVTLIFLPISYGIGSNVPPIPLRCTPILAFKFDCARLPGWMRRKCVGAERVARFPSRMPRSASQREDH